MFLIENDMLWFPGLIHTLLIVCPQITLRDSFASLMSDVLTAALGSSSLANLLISSLYLWLFFQSWKKSDGPLKKKPINWQMDWKPQQCISSNTVLGSAGCPRRAEPPHSGYEKPNLIPYSCENATLCEFMEKWM